MDGEKCGGRRAPLGQFLDNQAGIEPTHAQAAGCLRGIHPHEAQFPCLTQRVFGKDRLRIPQRRVGGKYTLGKRARAGDKGVLVFEVTDKFFKIIKGWAHRIIDLLNFLENFGD